MFADLYRPWSRQDRRGRDDAIHRPLRKYAWIEAEHPRTAKGEFIAFLTGAVEGAWSGLTDTVEGLGAWAAAGGNLFTDPEALAKALEISKHVAQAAYDYGKAVADDPVKAFRDIRDGASSVYSAIDQMHTQAVADRREAEFWGWGAFEIGSLFIAFGEIAKAGKLGMVVKTAEAAVRDFDSWFQPLEKPGAGADIRFSVAGHGKRPQTPAGDQPQGRSPAATTGNGSCCCLPVRTRCPARP